MSKLFVDEIVHQSSQGSGTITLGASGETVALASGASQTMAVNTPAFLAYRNSNQSLSDNTETKVQFNTEEFDSDNCFDNATNYRFTPTTAGKYFLFGTAFVGGSTADTTEYSIRIKKNGTNIATNAIDRRTSGLGYNNQFITSTISSANGSSDYFELHVVMIGGGTKNIVSGIQNTFFGAYKIIGA